MIYLQANSIKNKNKVDGVQEFVEIIVCLYTLNKIEFTEGEVLRYVKSISCDNLYLMAKLESQ